jgi:hypothetical protein
LIVTNGSFEQEEIEFCEKLLRKISDEDINKYITIVRANFPEFSNPEECEKERQSIIRKGQEEIEKGNEEFGKMISENRDKIIFVDNSNKEARRILLEHLATCQDSYNTQLLHGLIEVFPK